MARDRFTWKDPQFTYADAVTASRLVMLPFLLYGLGARLSGLALATLAAMLATDLVDGRIARRLGQVRPFGAALDATIDFLVIYSLFTMFFVLGILPWWKWLAILGPAVLMAVTQTISFLRAERVALAPAAFGKLVGLIQFIYLPLLLARTFWLTGGRGVGADHALFAVLMIASALNTVDYGRTLARLLGTRTRSTTG
jgi:phosphatidylglycerophosphate synthase